ncbi:hypothetical protein D0962_21125 [Leptolyngbyaceae cyanobacterium CCMR0082]|uniref:Uncharacterized protein n=1 Tax=Adonisia turfae CCMR0082 TaxID=2304604 RepID=A0A6M0S9S1_9CYAN|nr:hypothetical protein [Adonisia turfae]NEZ65247.1 hypothetical protein [Adonisia turfae CCMR0082]
MISVELSYRNFSASEDNESELERLCELLREQLQKELYEEVSDDFKEVILLLNEMGHNLKFYDTYNLTGDGYRDDLIDYEYRCLLRVAFSIVVSVAYIEIL